MELNEKCLKIQMVNWFRIAWIVKNAIQIHVQMMHWLMRLMMREGFWIAQDLRKYESTTM